MDLPAELIDQAHRVPHDCDPLLQASPTHRRRLILADPDVDTGDRWVAEVVTCERGITTARVLPLPSRSPHSGADAWLRARVLALVAGDSDALSLEHVERAGALAPEWQEEPRARVLHCARSPATAARVLERRLAERDRHRQGTFYTSPGEIDLAVRGAMYELLTERLEVTSQLAQGQLAGWVFGGDPSLPVDLAARALAILDELTILDPACGAGSFLVGALHITADLAARAAADAGRRPWAAGDLRALASRARGIDVDADALELARVRLQGWGGSPGDLVLADALLTPCVGADLVVGNPPYVRHEEIAEPGRSDAGRATGNGARRYKKAIATAAKARGHSIPARADLYLHFVHLAMDCLRPGGAAGLVLSASWLDLDYARALRERLGPGGALRQVHESRAGRSFRDADVNAVVLVMGACRGELARFVSWATPFEDGLAATEVGRFLCAPAGSSVTDAARTRVVPTELLEPSTGWGGPFLRAPAVYDRFRTAPGLVRLEDVAKVRFGLKTGANEFFYLDDDRAREHRLPAELLRPMLTSARECPGYRTSTAMVRRSLFSSADPRADRGSAGVAAYIAQARAKGIHRRPSVASRQPWWDLGQREHAHAILPRRIGERFACYENDAELLEDNNLFGIDPTGGMDLALLLAAINCTWTRLSLELVSRPLTGAQPLIDTNVYIVRALQIPDLRLAPAEVRERALCAWTSMRNRDALPIAAECDHEDRRTLDRAVFCHLGAPAPVVEELVDELHREVCEMVANRLSKADRVPRLHG